MSAVGAFSWRWPEGIENYERIWIAIADVDGTESQIRHGVGQRDAFGRSRLRAVTWFEGEPLVEGVEAYDFSQSQSLLSLIKITKSTCRRVTRCRRSGPKTPAADEPRQRFDDFAGIGQKRRAWRSRCKSGPIGKAMGHHQARHDPKGPRCQAVSAKPPVTNRSPCDLVAWQ
jgi:hypothetical protein